MGIIWNQELGKSECPYLQRWALETKWFTVRLHHWISSDDQRHYHDHPWWFLTLILRGGYTDISPSGEQRMTAGSIAFRPAEHRHTVRVDAGGCWSLMLTGPDSRVWGFWVKGRFRKRNKYFFEWGQHPCDQQK
jgi:hypothetical protein